MLYEVITTHCPSYNLFNYLFDCFSESNERLIINLDIDYFFCGNPNYFILFSDNAIKRLINDIFKLASDKKNILTIALSPDCCGSWKNSVNFIQKYFARYDIKIE